MPSGHSVRARTAEPLNASNVPSDNACQLSGGEQRRLRKLMSSNEGKIETIRGKITGKQAELAAADPTDYQLLTAIQEEIADLEEDISVLELEWFDAAERLGQ